MPEVLFNLQNIKKEFAAGRNMTVKALDDVSFDIFKGETLSLVGESGCGKTTCGRMLLGIYKPGSGRILSRGQDIAGFSREEKKRFCKKNTMIFQDPYSCLDPRMSVGSIIEEGLRVHFPFSRKEYPDRIKAVLARVGLTSDYVSRFPHELSGGQRQRVGIARALVLEPEFLVCDEPIAALDVSIQAQIINLLIDLQRQDGLTYLFISHDLSMVRHISDRIAVMYLGSLMELAGAGELFNTPLHPYTRTLFSAIPAALGASSKKKERIRLIGEIPSPMEIPRGCKFSTRCPDARDICKSAVPPLRDLADGHFCACHLV
jgi:oligopeptide transport system ATP-binding protein